MKKLLLLCILAIRLHAMQEIELRSFDPNAAQTLLEKNSHRFTYEDTTPRPSSTLSNDLQPYLVKKVTVNPDGNVIATHHKKKDNSFRPNPQSTIILWGQQYGLLQELCRYEQSSDCAFNAGNTHFVVCANKTLTVLSIPELETIASADHEADITRISDDGKLITTWHSTNNQQITCFELEGAILQPKRIIAICPISLHPDPTGYPSISKEEYERRLHAHGHHLFTFNNKIIYHAHENALSVVDVSTGEQTELATDCCVKSFTLPSKKPKLLLAAHDKAVYFIDWQKNTVIRTFNWNNVHDPLAEITCNPEGTALALRYLTSYSYHYGTHTAHLYTYSIVGANLFLIDSHELVKGEFRNYKQSACAFTPHGIGHITVTNNSEQPFTITLLRPLHLINRQYGLPLTEDEVQKALNATKETYVTSSTIQEIVRALLEKILAKSSAKTR